LIKAVEVTVSRGFTEETPRFLSKLSILAETDEYCLAALIKVYDLLGIPSPTLDRVARQAPAIARQKLKPSTIVTDLASSSPPVGVIETAEAPAAKSKLWLPGS
jgi:hypothetical protein